MAQDLATTMIHQRHGTIATRHAMHTMTTMTTIAMANGAGHRNTTDTAMAIGWCDTGTFATRAHWPASDQIIGGSGSGSISTMMSGVSFLGEPSLLSVGDAKRFLDVAIRHANGPFILERITVGPLAPESIREACGSGRQ